MNLVADQYEIPTDCPTTLAAVEPAGAWLIRYEDERQRIAAEPKSYLGKASRLAKRVLVGAMLADVDADIALQQARPMEIAALRQQLQGYQPWQREMLNPDIANVLQEIDLVPADTSRDMVAHVVALPDDDFISYFRAHNERMRQINQAPETAAKIADSKTVYGQMIRAAVDAESLPEVALDAIPRVTVVPVGITDAYDLAERGGAAYCDLETDEVMAGEHVDTHVLGHEYSHMAFPRFPYLPFDEGVVEQLTVNLETGIFDSFYPQPTDNSTYREKRVAIQTFLESGAEPIAAKRMTDALVNSDPDGLPYAFLNADINAAYPHMQVFRYLDHRREIAQVAIDRRHPDVPHHVVEAGVDTYSSFSLWALSAVQKHHPINDVLGVLERCAEGNERVLHNVLQSRHEMPVRYQQKLEVVAYSARKVAMDFERGTAFLT